MAGLSDRLRKVGGNSLNVSSTFSNRSESELKIGLNNKSFIDSKFTRLIEAPTIIGDYYQLDSNESSFSEHLKLVKDPSKSLFFNKINKFVMYNLSPSEEIDPKDDPERSPMINLSNKQVVILAGTIRPKEGDCFVMYSHGRIKRVFQVSRVDEKLLIDREVYEVQFIESQMWLYEEIERQVRKESTYLEANVGSGNKVIIENNLVKDITRVNQLLHDLNTSYIELFYSETYDIIGLRNPIDHHALFSIRSLTKFQEEKGVLKYGFDSGTLFINNDYVFKTEQNNYNKSLYNKIPKHKHIVEDQIIDPDFSQSPDKAFLTLMKEFERYAIINNYDRDLDVIEGERRYCFDFYYRSFCHHMVMTNLFNSNIVLYELLESNPNLYNLNNNYVESKPTSFRLYLSNKLYHDILSKWYEVKANSLPGKLYMDFFEYIMSIIELLEDYTLYGNDIVDMIFFPLIKYLIEESIREITKDEMITSY